MWLFAAIACALQVSRALGARAAVFIAGLLMLALLADFRMYRQFIPGRIDHHNVQIVMAMITLASALARGPRWAAVAGAAARPWVAGGFEGLPLPAPLRARLGVP